MLIYDPALDPYHTSIRILAIASPSGSRQTELTIDAARIADYFLVYPSKMSRFKFPAEFRAIRAAIKETVNPYRHANGNRAVFDRMRPIFFAALSGLIASHLIEEAAAKKGQVVRSQIQLPNELASAVQRFQDRQSTIGKFLLSDFLSIPTTGDSGLKQRSSLIEHRYDIDTTPI
jgi:hypothetical protein